MDFSIVIPVYNEQDNIRRLIAEIDVCLSKTPDYEIVCVNDGSTDNTRDELLKLVNEYARLRVVEHVTNAGQSAAILSGVAAARASWIVTVDGDGQNDPADIPRLREVCESARDPLQMIIGRRTRRCDTWLKQVSSRAANAIRRAVLQDGTPDTGCGLKLFFRDMFLQLPRFNHMHRFLPALFQHAGGNIASIDVNHRPRIAGDSKYGIHDRLWVGIVDLFGVWWLQRRILRPDAKMLTKKDIE
jgi:dolichol-phosphate mannosyltransferase